MALNCEASSPIQLKFELHWDFMPVLVPSKFEEDLIENELHCQDPNWLGPKKLRSELTRAESSKVRIDSYGMYGTGLESLACKMKCRREVFLTKMINPYPHCGLCYQPV